MTRMTVLGLTLGLAATAWSADLSWERDWSHTAELPVIAISGDDTARAGELEWRLTAADGQVTATGVIPYHLEPGVAATFESLAALPPLDQIVLCEVFDRSGQVTPARLEGVFGPAQPFEPGRDRLVGMNVHLGRYTPSDRWRVLQMMRDAGVSTVRVDSDFVDPAAEPQRAEECANRLEEELLALEAFGMEPLVLLGYFPGTFYESPHKLQMAYEWSRALVARFPGRASWHYGNETNSGWAGFGAAADMGALHKGYALGTAAADPQARRGSFGIAEGLPGYAQAFLATGAGDYLEALCVHPYSGSPESGIAKTLANQRLLRPDQEVWATEIGFHVDDTEVGVNPLTMALTRVMGFSTAQQAAFLSRLFLLGKSTGVDRLYWYDFFGKDDAETFWLVDAEFQPKPAYHALANVTDWLAGAEALGGTALQERVQRHFFRRPDGRVFLAAWTQQQPEHIAAPYLTGAALFALDGRAVGSCDGTLALTEAPVFALLPEDSTFDGFLAREAVASAMNATSFNAPAHRFFAEPGTVVTVPFSLFNSSAAPLAVQPAQRRGNANWQLKTPAAIQVPAGQTVETALELTVPEQAVPGVEYHFSFDGELADGRRTAAYPVRIKIPGEFPYRALLAYDQPRDYPMWDPMREPEMGFGRAVTAAGAAAATIDGRLEEWQPAEFVELDQKLAWLLRDPQLPTTEDFTVKTAFRWDREQLYVAFLVLDDDLSLLDTVSRDWRDSDNLRIFLSTEADESRRGDQISEQELLLILAASDVEHTGKPAAFAAVLGGHARQGVEEQLKLATQIWASGYAMEVAIPWAVLGVTPSSGMKLGLNVLADDADDGYRRHTAMTTLKRADYWINPKSLGVLELQ